MLEVETIAQFESILRDNKSIENVVFQGLDLTSYTPLLCQQDLAGASFLGCQLESRALQHAYKCQALVFPTIPDKPFSSYRGSLYTVDDLFSGFDPAKPDSYSATLDARIYEHWKRSGRSQPESILETLARRLHDHAITNAVKGLLKDRQPQSKAVGIMGGHSMLRSDPNYLAVAEMARALTREGFFMLSGGGPGAMEATHLGAWFATRPDHELVDASKVLSSAPHYKDPMWLSKAFQVRQQYPLEAPEKCASLGIPTWHYGHEPPNPFATHIAKYFANSIREDGLLTLAKYGCIFAPGAAGTIQEIFQNACQNRYKTRDFASPMIFYGEDYWKWKTPVFPLIAQLAIGKEYGQYIRITDKAADAVSVILKYSETLDLL